MKNLALVWVLAACLLGCGGRDKDAKNKAVPAVDTAAVIPDTVAAAPDTVVIALDTVAVAPDTTPKPVAKKPKPVITTFTDSRDGKVYKIVKIGSQTWFAENLNYAAEGSKCYGEDGFVINIDRLFNTDVQANCTKYGRLYNWKTALTACPAGTHLPTDEEWTTLVDYVGGSKIAGKKLKSTNGWGYEDRSTNEYGFSALPGGYGYLDVRFSYADSYGYWWGATECDAYYVWRRDMLYNHEGVLRSYGDKRVLNSVRCVLDDEKEKRK